MIRTMLQLAGAALVAIALAALPGCGGSKTPASKTPAKAGHYEGDGHDHSKDKSDHTDHDREKEGEHK
jgi:hypothetical protein